MDGIYIYFRLAAAPAPEFVRSLTEGIASLPGNDAGSVRLLHKAADPLTLMEVFEDVTDVPALIAAHDRLWHNSGWNMLLAAGTARHVEHFVAFPGCV